MNKTKIQYLDYTWNPIAMRCTPISSGCANCWHLRMCDRMAENPRIAHTLRQAYAGEIGPQLVERRLDDPTKLRKPAIIGVQFMGDLFHENVPDRIIADEIWPRTRIAWWHTFVILTKRPHRARNLLATFSNTCYEFPNVWVGVSVENQSAVSRIVPLLSTKAARRIISFEPLLDEIMIRPEYLREIDLVIVGCESGPNRRFTSKTWIRSLRDQCLALGDDGPAFFLKQMAVDGKVVSMPELDGRTWPE